uniref:ATP synthase complex subunit 8 n=1 Tax=Lepinotus reticulatus TaxID=209981 RepID=A0A3S8IEA7_9NEOP|nr:ATP synthase F0 subunit 8 [Lepinotus reticulatus]
MPQMSPLPWLSLFSFFILLVLLSSSLTYFFFSPKLSFKKQKINAQVLDWKW